MTGEDVKYRNVVAVISVFMLLLAIPRLPYGYYIFLRWVVSLSALFSAWVAHSLEKRSWVIVMGGIAILFNPIVPVHLTKETWVVIDLIVAVLFLISIFQIRPKDQVLSERKPHNLEEEETERDKAFLKCWKKGMSDEELAREFDLKIEGVKALKQRLRGLQNQQSH